MGVLDDAIGPPNYIASHHVLYKCANVNDVFYCTSNNTMYALLDDRVWMPFSIDLHRGRHKILIKRLLLFSKFVVK